MDDECFHPSETELLERFRHKVEGGTIVTKRVIYSHPKHNQAIIALGSKRDAFDQPFSECGGGVLV